MPCTTEVVRLIWEDKEGVAIYVGPDSDSLGMVEVRPHDEKSREYFGNFRFTMHPEMAMQIAEAIKRAALDVPPGR